MADIKAIKKAIVDQHQKELPLMDVEKMRQGVLDWLRQIRYPSGSPGSSWEDLLRVYPTEEGDKQLESGVIIRLALALHTTQNAYLLSLMECLAPDSREVYILCAHVNWKESEKRLQKSLDEGYVGSFEDVLRARHTVWAQTFRESELPEALNSCALALLGRELVAHGPAAESAKSNGLLRSELSDAPEDTNPPQTIRRSVVPMTDFPTQD
jgi:hypothetical protein